MKTSTSVLSLAVAAALAAGVGGAALNEAPDESQTPTLDQIKQLAGEWVALDEAVQPTDVVVSRYRVTAGGSAVLEIMFPGTEKEMVTMYHQDGDDLVMTHYCMLGNQPHMRATRDSAAGTLVFTCDGHGSNMTSENDAHMHQGTFTFLGPDRLDADWQMMENGQVGHSSTFSVTRAEKSGAR